MEYTKASSFYDENIDPRNQPKTKNKNKKSIEKKG